MPRFNKKDSEVIAKVLANAKARTQYTGTGAAYAAAVFQWTKVRDDIADMFAADNATFRRDIFIKLCDLDTHRVEEIKAELTNKQTKKILSHPLDRPGIAIQFQCNKCDAENSIKVGSWGYRCSECGSFDFTMTEKIVKKDA